MKRFLPLLLLPLLLFAACKKVPDHAKYIPKSALTVVGVNLNALGKKMLWDKITGSGATAGLDSAFKTMGTDLDAKNLENSGVNTSSTIYAYIPSTPTTDGGGTGDPGLVAILPLEDAGKWAEFVKKMDAGMQVQKSGENMTATSKNMSVLWTKDVAFVTNNPKSAGKYEYLPDGTEEYREGTLDMAKAMTTLQGAVAITKEGSLVQDERFTDMEKEGNDITIWVNYEEMMSKMGAAVAMSAQLMKETAIASALNFEKGELDAKMRYYVSPVMKDATAKMGDGSLPGEMMDKMPKQNLAGFIGMSLSTQGLKMVLEKAGLMGVANMGLASQGLTMDDVLDAMSGDIIASFNNFTVVTQMSGTGEYAYERTDPKVDYALALKLGKKEAVAKLMKFFTSRNMLTQVAPGLYTIPGSGDMGAIAMNDNYMVACNTAAQAQAWLGSKGSGSLPEDAQNLTNEGPLSMYVNAQALMKGFASTVKGEKDKAMLAASQAVFQSLSMKGGKFSSGSSNYSGKLQMVNKEENALVQLVSYFGKMKAIDKMPDPEITPAYPTEVPMIEAPMESPAL